MPQSFSVEATTVTSCAPLVEAPPHTEVAWRTLAKACSSSLVLEPCGDIGKLCAPPSGKSLEDSQQCIFYRGADLPCPLGYSERHVVYGAVGDITCSPCTCLPPEGSVCEAALQMYTDATCSQGDRNVPASLDMERCWPVNTIPGQVGSVEAVFTVNQPGTCAPQGGQMIGGGVPVQPATFCCM
ncbi:hypothetical protein [Chondromyces apiculatus]|nr:hypothetical protein [Chondromyces apiculatus]